MDLHSPRSCWCINFSTTSHLSKCVTCAVSCETYTHCSTLILLQGSSFLIEVNLESKDKSSTKAAVRKIIFTDYHIWLCIIVSLIIHDR